MGIADDVRAHMDEHGTKKLCKVGAVLAALGAEDESALSYAIKRARDEASLPQNQRVFTASFVQRLLTNNDHPVGVTTVKDHLARKCNCDD